MIVYFTDRYMNILGKASTSLPQGMRLKNDVMTDEIEAGGKTLEFSISYDRNKRALVENMTTPGNYLLKKSDDERGFYTIIDIDTKTRTVEVYAENAGLDLLNETATAYVNTTAHPIAYYIDKFAYDSGWVIGINEISDRSRTLSWDGESSVTERLLSIATQFDAEIGFSFKIERMKVAKKLINI